MVTLVTNNPLAQEQFRGEILTEYMEISLLGVLIRVRDHVHGGSQLLTHPLSGSVKPNETPYKSVLVSETQGKADPKSVHIIEECILTAKKFPIKHIPEKFLPDLQIVDLALIQGACDSFQTPHI